MICPAYVNLSTIAAHNRGSVNVFVQDENGLVGGNGDGRAFFPFGENLEQQLGAAPVQLKVSQLVDKDQVNSAVAVDQLGQLLSSAASTSSLTSLLASV
jgi:hypothetical protein